MAPIEKEFMSLEEVAQLMDVNYQLIYKLVRGGELRAARLGKVYRVHKQDLEAYLERSKAESAGLLCSACGRTYQSRHSLSQQCADCGRPICVDCWTRRAIRYCAEDEARRQNEKGKK